MNRRFFLKSLAAGAALLAAPKLLLPVAEPLETQHKAQVELPSPRDFSRLDARAKAKEALARWWSDEFDKLLYESLTA